MRRCPTCRADSPKLVHFGIYLCPTCGPIDADGQPVAPPPGVLLTPAAAPQVYESLRGAAPTPVADDTQPNPIAFPPPVPRAAPAPMPMPVPVELAPPRPVPLELAPPMPMPMPVEVAPPRPVPLELAPPRPTPVPGAPSPFAAPAPVPAALAPPHPRVSSPDPLTVVPPPSELSRSSFAPPPPRDPRELVTSGSGPPRILMISLALYATVSLLGLVASSDARGPRDGIRVMSQIVFSVAILSGRRWARNWSLFVNGLALLFLLIVILLPVPPALRAISAVSAMATGWWIYVLLRRDVVDYCRQ